MKRLVASSPHVPHFACRRCLGSMNGFRAAKSGPTGVRPVTFGQAAARTNLQLMNPAQQLLSTRRSTASKALAPVSGKRLRNPNEGCTRPTGRDCPNSAIINGSRVTTNRPEAIRSRKLLLRNALKSRNGAKIEPNSRSRELLQGCRICLRLIPKCFKGGTNAKPHAICESKGRPLNLLRNRRTDRRSHRRKGIAEQPAKCRIAAGDRGCDADCYCAASVEIFS